MAESDDTYVDDPSIENSSPLWRRVPPFHFVYDQKLKRKRLSSAAFEDHPNGSPMSVVLGNDVLASNRGPDAILKGHEGFGLVSFTAGLARSKGQGIVKKPLAEEPAHAEVFGKKTKAVQRELAKGCDWIVHMPDDVDVA